MGFDYFYEGEEDDFSFIRIPKALFSNPIYAELSNDARMLYGLILDRMTLSRKNGWTDDKGRIYIVYTMKSIEKEISVGHTKAAQLLDMLERFRLILRVRQGMGRPNRIYPKRFSSADLRIKDIMTSGFRKSGSSECGHHDDLNTDTNNTDNNDIERNDTLSYPSLADPKGSGPQRREMIKWIDEQCSFSTLIHDMPESREEILEIRELILDVLSCRNPEIRICGELKNSEAVKGRFMKLNAEHIRYVMGSLSENTTAVKNIKQYLLAALYNAPATIGSYYRAKVNYDMYGDRRS